jgi:hypothetical protein
LGNRSSAYTQATRSGLRVKHCPLRSLPQVAAVYSAAFPSSLTNRGRPDFRRPRSITSHFSPIRRASLAPSGPLTSHPIPKPLIPHGRDSGLAVRLQDLFFVLPQCVDLGLLAIAAPFRSAYHLKKRLGSGFETISISQCESALRVSDPDYNRHYLPC